MPAETDPFRSLGTKDASKAIDIPREVVRLSVETWAEIREPILTHSLAYTLSRRMRSLCGVEWDGPWDYDRAADALVQRLKVAGFIERFPQRRGWRLTDEGRRAILNLPPRNSTEEAARA